MYFHVKVCAGDEVIREEQIHLPNSPATPEAEAVAYLLSNELVFAHEPEEIKGRRVTVQISLEGGGVPSQPADRSPGVPSSMTGLERYAALERWRRGESLIEIAEGVGCSLSDLSTWLHEDSMGQRFHTEPGGSHPENG